MTKLTLTWTPDDPRKRLEEHRNGHSNQWSCGLSFSDFCTRARERSVINWWTPMLDMRSRLTVGQFGRILYAMKVSPNHSLAILGLARVFSSLTITSLVMLFGYATLHDRFLFLVFGGWTMKDPIHIMFCIQVHAPCEILIENLIVLFITTFNW